MTDSGPGVAVRNGIGPGIGRLRQAAIYRAGAMGRRPRLPTSYDALAERARKTMSRAAFAYVAGGAGREDTVRANAEGFDRWGIVPRVLRDVSTRDLSVDLFGRTLPAPVVLGPVGVLSLAHRDADLAVARAAARLGLPMVFSNQASVAMEDCATAMGGSPRWFQLYWSSIDELVESFVARAEACGCEALVVTLDTTMLGWRPRDLDLGSLPFARGQGIAQYTSDPVFQHLAEQRARSAEPESTGRPTPKALRTLAEISRNHPGRFADNLRSPVPRAAVQLFLESYSRPSITWDDLAWLRQRTRLPIVLKGVLHADDAHQAVDRGVDGIVVSTHGGRQVDGAIGAVDARPACSRPWPVAFRCCSTAASAAGPTSSRRWPSAPRPCSSRVRGCTDWRWPAKPGCTRLWRTSWPNSI
jgi:lactate 2-monooxygenase